MKDVDHVKARAREVLAGAGDGATATPGLVSCLVEALETTEAERDDLTARIIEAADALSPAMGATVGGRGVAMAARHVVAELDLLRAAIRSERPPRRTHALTAYVQILWHRWALRHWQTDRLNGAEPPAVICGCGVVWEDSST